MKQTIKPTQLIKVSGMEATKTMKQQSSLHSQSQGPQRSLLNPSGLFSPRPDARIIPSAKVLDMDDDNFMSFFKPKLEPQLSVLSTDSGILPMDIRNSSFVDDVIGELTSQGICHSDIISGEVAATTDATALAVKLPGDCNVLHKRKASSPHVLFHDSDATDSATVSSNHCSGPSTCTSNEIKRIKNNEASRKSRANRKQKHTMKEQEISALEEDNQRLSLLLKDFNEVAAICKHWLVRKMESPAEV